VAIARKILLQVAAQDIGQLTDFASRPSASSGLPESTEYLVSCGNSGASEAFLRTYLIYR
jgi:hypothetical protein